MMMLGPVPVCPSMPSPGAQGGAPDTPPTLATAIAVFATALIGGIFGLGLYVFIAAIHPIVALVVLEVWAIIVVAAAVGFIYVFFRKRCSQPAGETKCIAGVVNNVIPAFSSWTDILFPFTAMHDRIDLVTRCQYWPLVTAGAAFVEASPKDGSPILQVFVFNDEVCNAVIYAFVGGVIGGLLFGSAGALVAAPICSIPPLCSLALLVVFLVSLLGVFLGQLIGGNIAHLTTRFPPTTPVVPKGEYFAAQGTLIVDDDLKGAVIMWFADSTATHGSSNDVSGLTTGFSHTDPDINFNPDSCPLAPQLN
jgi:hypothetical protein